MTVAIEDTTHRAEQELGPAIDNGLVRWVSSTLVTQGDHNSEGGCLRRLWFERVGDQPRITTAAMTAGVGMHKEIETYLTTGNRGVLGPVALAGLHYIPEPGNGLIVEQPIIVGGDGVIRGVYIRAAGIPFAGHVDLYNHRGEYIDPEGELRRDPANTLEIKDWKSTSDIVWAKSAAQVADTIQMNAYAMAGFAMWPHLEHGRLTHVYFQRNGVPVAKLATSRPPREQIERKWKYTEGIVRTIVDVAREEDPRRVPYNTKACHSYNKDCPHLALCEEGKASRTFDSLEDMFGPRMAELLTSDLAARAGTHITAEESDDMGFLDMVATPAVTEVTPPAGVGAAISLDDLVAEEAAARATVSTAPPPVQPTPEFVAAMALIGASGLGMPPLGGTAAAMFAASGGQAIAPGATFPGQLKLAKLKEMSEPAELIALAEEIKRKMPNVTVPAPAAATVVVPTPKTVQHNSVAQVAPPDAPASSPALAANPVPGLENAKTRELAAAQSPGPIEGLAESVPAGGVFASTPAPVAATPTPTVVATGTTPAPAPADAKPTTRRGRPPGAKNKTKSDDAATAENGDTSLSLYADVAHDGLDLAPLDTYVKEACECLIKNFAPDAGDIRCAANDTKLGFAKWRGALTALVQKQPPAPGSYYIDTRGDELGELVFVALREVCRTTGGVHVRGIK